MPGCDGTSLRAITSTYGPPLIETAFRLPGNGWGLLQARMEENAECMPVIITCWAMDASIP